MSNSNKDNKSDFDQKDNTVDQKDMIKKEAMEGAVILNDIILKYWVIHNNRQCRPNQHPPERF